jgi:hypothetical protein
MLLQVIIFRKKMFSCIVIYIHYIGYLLLASPPPTNNTINTVAMNPKNVGFISCGYNNNSKWLASMEVLDTVDIRTVHKTRIIGNSCCLLMT